MIVVDLRPHDPGGSKFGDADVWINDALKIGTIYKNEFGGYTADTGRGHRYWQGFVRWEEALMHLLAESKQLVIKE